MSLPYFPFYPTDYMADAAHLSLEEHGAYLRLLCLCWTTPGCSIPADEEWIRRKLAVTPETFQRVVAPLLKEFFRRNRSRYYSARLSTEHANASSAKNGKSRGGKESARKRKALKTQKTEVKIPASDLGDTRALPEPESEPEEEEVVVAAARAEPQDCDADDPGSWTDDRLREEVMAAVGLQGPPIPTHWMPPAATVHVGRWRTELGLDASRIVDAARSNRARHTGPPNGPKALDAVMCRLASELQAEPLRPEASPPRTANGHRPLTQADLLAMIRQPPERPQ